MTEQQLEKLNKLFHFTDETMIIFRNYYAYAISRSKVEEHIQNWLILRKEITEMDTK